MQHQQLNQQQQEVLGILQQNQTKAQSVEDRQLQARARSLMPLDSWRQAANEQYQLNRQLEPDTVTTAADDLVVKSMLLWFKHDFFAWVRQCCSNSQNALDSNPEMLGLCACHVCSCVACCLQCPNKQQLFTHMTGLALISKEGGYL